MQLRSAWRDIMSRSHPQIPGSACSSSGTKYFFTPWNYLLKMLHVLSDDFLDKWSFKRGILTAQFLFM